MGAAGYKAGAAFVEVVPAFPGFQKAVEAHFRDAGAEGGKTFAQAWEGSAGPRLQAALNSLPDAKIGADASEADREIKQLRDEMEMLGVKRIGIEISEADAKAKLAEIVAQLHSIQDAHADVKIDTAAAIGELVALEAEIKTLSEARQEAATIKVSADLTPFERRLDAALMSAKGQIAEIKVDGDTSPGRRKAAELREEIEALQVNIRAGIDDRWAMVRLAELRAKAEELSKDTVELDVRVDAGGAAAKLAALEAEVDKLDGRKVDAKADADTAAATAKLGSLSALMSAISLQGLAMGGGIVAGLAIAGPAVAVVTAAVMGLGMALAAVGLGFGVVMLAEIPLVKAWQAQQAASEQAGHAAQAAAERIQSAERRVADAVERGAEARRRAAEQAVASAERVVDAQRALQDAVRREEDAQRAVSAARDTARAALRSLNEEIEQNALSEKGAELALERARERLAHLGRTALDVAAAEHSLAEAQRRAIMDPTDAGAQLAVAQAKARLEETRAGVGGSSLDRREAELAVEQAKARLESLRAKTRDLQTQRALADRVGVDGSRQVRTALEQQQSAHDAVARASQQVIRARRDQARAADESARQIERADRDVARAQEDLTKAHRQTGDEATAASRKAQQALDALSPAGRRLLDLVASIGRGISHLGITAMDSMAPGLLRAAQIIAPGFRSLDALVGRVGRTVGGIAVEAAQALSGPRWTGILGRFAADLPGVLVTTARIAGSVVTGLVTILDGLRPVGLWFLTWLAGVAARFAAWATSAQGRQQIAAFGAWVMRTAPVVGRAVWEIVKAVVGVGVALAPLGVQLLGLITTGARWLASLPPETIREIGTAILGVVAALAGLKIFSAIGAALTTLKPLINGLILLLTGSGEAGAAGGLVGALGAIGPIGWAVIAVIAALGAGFVAAWNTSERFRVVVKQLWDSISKDVMEVYHKVLEPFVTWLVRAWNKDIGPGMTRLWNEVLEPFFTGLAKVILWFWNTILHPQIKLWIWLWTGVLGPVLASLWDKVIKPLGSNILRFLIATKEAINVFVGAVSTIWRRLQRVFTIPIRWILEWPVNKGLISGFNWISSKVGGPHIDPVPLPSIPAWNSGGYVPGHVVDDGRDNMLVSLIGSGGARGIAAIKSGEFIHPVASVAYYGVTLMEALRRRLIPREALASLLGGATPAYASGGPVGTIPSYASGGLTLDPTAYLRDMASWYLAQTPGSGPMIDILKAAPMSLVGALAGRVWSMVSSLARGIKDGVKSAGGALLNLVGFADGGMVTGPSPGPPRPPGLGPGMVPAFASGGLVGSIPRLSVGGSVPRLSVPSLARITGPASRGMTLAPQAGPAMVGLAPGLEEALLAAADRPVVVEIDGRVWARGVKEAIRFNEERGGDGPARR